jgi:hypothetical protein
LWKEKWINNPRFIAIILRQQIKKWAMHHFFAPFILEMAQKMDQTVIVAD